MAVVGLLSVVGEAQASGPITVDQAVSQAVARPALLATLAADAQTAEAEAVAAGVWPNPEVTYEREQLAAVEETLAISQDIDLAGRRGLRADAARKRAEATRLDGEARRRRVAIAARHGFWEVVHQQAHHHVSGIWLQRLEAAEAQTVAREKAGEGSRYDVLRMGREVRRARTELQVAELEREAAWLHLLALTGPLSAPEGWPRVTGEMLPADVGGDDGPVRPDVQAWRARAEAARLEASAAGRGWVPQMGLTAGFKRVGETDTRDSGFAAGVTVSVPLFDRNQGEAERARAAQVRAEAISGLMEEDASRQARPVKERARRLTALARSVRLETEADTRALEATAQTAWLAGELSLTELLSVHRDARDDGLALLVLERAARDAREELRRLTLEEAP